YHSWSPANTAPKPITRPNKAGAANVLGRVSSEDLRQAINGPTPIRKMRASASGALTLLKNGGPTVILTPRTASDKTGNSVPQNTAKAIPTRTKLLNRNAASRDKYDSISAGDLSCLTRKSRRPVYATATAIRNVRKNGPSPDCVNECT